MVALVVVPFRAVKFCSVDDPVTRRELSVTTPLVSIERAATDEVA